MREYMFVCVCVYTGDVYTTKSYGKKQKQYSVSNLFLIPLHLLSFLECCAYHIILSTTVSHSPEMIC